MRNITVVLFVVLVIAQTPVFARPMVWHQGINETNIYVRGDPVTVAQQEVETDSAGMMIVRFNGVCVSSEGDRIVLAAADIPDWQSDSGNTTVEAISSDLNTNSFSHTRAYPVTAGNHTYYAVVENYVETDGTGSASIYASLTVAFFPDPDTGALAAHADISQPNTNVRGAPVVVGEASIQAPTSGMAFVRFDGTCIFTPGDRIILAASDHEDWEVDDGNVGVEVLDTDVNRRSFSHTRAYPVSADNHTFYAVAENYVETDGSGIASIYGSLTVEFYPDGALETLADHVGIAEANVDLRGEPVTVGQATIDAPLAGSVIVSFDGACISTEGDLIILAASDSPNWHVNDGNVSVQAVNSDINQSPFAHTRVYPVGPGPHSFYAVAENYVETGGSGVGHIYASLSAKFYATEDAPTPTAAPSSTPTEVPSATASPSPAVTDTPTATPPPGATETPTFTPPPGATDTPTTMPTPTAGPTSTPGCSVLGVEMEVSTSYVSPGELFSCNAMICNPADELTQQPFVAMLDVGIGEYWFYPTWVHYPPDFDFAPTDLPGNQITLVQVLPEFTWPDTGSGSFSGINLYGALLTPAMDAINGEIGLATFGYGP